MTRNKALLPLILIFAFTALSQTLPQGVRKITAVEGIPECKLPNGNRSDIENVPIQKLASFYQKYYQPDNALLTIAGKFDDAKTLAQVATLFGAIPKPTRTLEKSYTVEPTQDGERSITLRRVGDTQGLVAIYHVPAGSHPDAAALEVLAGVLGDHPSGRLYKALVDNKKAVAASMEMQELHDPGFLIASVSLKAVSYTHLTLPTKRIV